MAEINEKLDNLMTLVKGLESVIVAYSGGVDSTLVARICHDVLHENAIAVTATSKTYPLYELELAKKMAQRIGIRHIVTETDELSNKDFTSNPANRCYFCKKELFTKLREIATTYKFKNIVDGTNLDDEGDFRPGLMAARELGIHSPLKEIGLTKDDVRSISQSLGLDTWDKPSLACLSSRIPYGEDITTNKLDMISEAECFLQDMGIRHLRVRHHGTIARIEVMPEDMSFIINNELQRTNIINKFKGIGFNYIALDIEGLRSGSMNEVLTPKHISEHEQGNGYLQSQKGSSEIRRKDQCQRLESASDIAYRGMACHAPTMTMKSKPHLIIYTDGASRGNPGKAGIGIAIYKINPDSGSDPALLEEVSEYIGETTNNVAEYIALKRAMERAMTYNPEEVIFKLDSELLVKQLNKEYRIKSPNIIPLYKEVSELIKILPQCKIIYIPREENSCADKLANKGIDSAI